MPRCPFALPPSMRSLAPAALVAVVGLAALLEACREPFPELGETPPPLADAGVESGPSFELFGLAADGGGSQERASVNPRILVRLGESTRELPELWLFVGELSPYHAGRVRRGDLPSTLLDRIVPALSTPNDAEQGTYWLVPSRWLDAGESYTLGMVGVGVIGNFEVADDGWRRLERIWPHVDATAPAAVYCVDGGVAPSVGVTELLPGAVGARFDPLLGASHCGELRLLQALDASAHLVPPALLGPLRVHPAPFHFVPDAPVAPLACGEGEQPLLGACLRIEDDRLGLRSAGAALWVIDWDGGSLVVHGEAGLPVEVRGFRPGARLLVDFALRERAAAVREERRAIAFGAARPRVVVNEVLANALGSEPEQEWVELYNDGAAPAVLDGWQLSDGVGTSTLPSATLAPGAFALVVTQDFVRDDGVGVAVADEIPLLRVDALGKSGLSNSGEVLTLRAADGTLVARVPATAHPVAGRSLARRGDGSFAAHAEPGASPGEVNRF